MRLEFSAIDYRASKAEDPMILNDFHHLMVFLIIPYWINAQHKKSFLISFNHSTIVDLKWFLLLKIDTLKPVKIKLYFWRFYEIQFNIAKLHASESDIIHTCNVNLMIYLFTLIFRIIFAIKIILYIYMHIFIFFTIMIKVTW